MDQDFPVPVAVIFKRAHDAHVREPERLEIGLEGLDLRRKGRGIGVEIGEDESLPDFGAHLRQAAVRFGKVSGAFHQGRANELPRSVIVP